MQRVAEPLNHAGFADQVPERQRPHQRGGVGKQQHTEHQNGNGEENLLQFGHLTQLGHFDLPVFLRRQRPHDGRLDNRHQRHIGVSRYGDRAQQIRRQLGGHVDRRRAVRTADNPDGGGILQRKIENTGVLGESHGADQRPEDPELRRRPQQGRLGVGQQRAEIGHRPDPHEDQQREEPGFDPHTVQNPQQPVGPGNPRQRNVGQKPPEPDGQQQQRFIPFLNRQVEQQERDKHHDDPPPGLGERRHGVAVGVFGVGVHLGQGFKAGGLIEPSEHLAQALAVVLPFIGGHLIRCRRSRGHHRRCRPEKQKERCQ